MSIGIRLRKSSIAIENRETQNGHRARWTETGIPIPHANDERVGRKRLRGHTSILVDEGTVLGTYMLSRLSAKTRYTLDETPTSVVGIRPISP